MWCSDPYLNLLEKYGYCVVLVPKADMKPLQVLYRQGRQLERLGQLTTLFQAGSTIPLPPLSEDARAANISGQSTGSLKIGIGISLLSGILGALGGSGFDLEARYRQAKAVTFKFHDVLEDSVEIAKLDQYLTDADINPFSHHLATLLEAEQLYITTATIKSHQFTVEARKSDGTALTLKVPEIQQAVGANVTVSGQTEETSKLTYTGGTPLIFGFQAIQLFYDQGHYSAFEARSGLGLRQEGPTSILNPKKLASEGPFLRLGSS